MEAVFQTLENIYGALLGFKVTFADLQGRKMVLKTHSPIVDDMQMKHIEFCDHLVLWQLRVKAPPPEMREFGEDGFLSRVHFLRVLTPEEEQQWRVLSAADGP